MTLYSNFNCEAEGIEYTIHADPGCKSQSMMKMMGLPDDSLKFPTSNGGDVDCAKAMGDYVSFRAKGWDN